MNENELHKRYGELVDKKFLNGLTLGEAFELAKVGAQLDVINEAYYRPIIDSLQKELEAQQEQRP